MFTNNNKQGKLRDAVVIPKNPGQPWCAMQCDPSHPRPAAALPPNSRSHPTNPKRQLPDRETAPDPWASWACPPQASSVEATKAPPGRPRIRCRVCLTGKSKQQAAGSSAAQRKPEEMPRSATGIKSCGRIDDGENDGWHGFPQWLLCSQRSTKYSTLRNPCAREILRSREWGRERHVAAATLG